MKLKQNSPKSNENTSGYRKHQTLSLANIIKLPNLGKTNSPQLGNKFFANPEELKINLKLERKSNHSLSNFTFGKLAEEVACLRSNEKGKKKESLNLQFKQINEIDENFSERHLQEKGFAEKESLNGIKSERINKNEGNEISIKEDIREAQRKAVKSFSNSPVNVIRILSKEKTESNGNENEEIQSLLTALNQTKEELNLTKSSLEEQKSKFKALENEFLLLNMKLKSYEQKIIEAEKLINLNNSLKDEISDLKFKMQSDMNKYDSEINELKSEILIKSKEFQEMSELLQKMENQKKRFVDNLKNVDNEIINLRDEKIKLAKKLEEMNSNLIISTEKLVNEKNKTSQFEKISKDLQSLKSENILINEKMNTLGKENTALKSEINTIQNNFSLKRSKWREVKKTYKARIFELENQISKEKNFVSVKIAEAFKVKRSISIRDVDSIDKINKESIFKFQSKVSDLESSLAFTKSEYEKLQKSIEYYKIQLENKSHIISMLESKTLNQESNGTSIAKNERNEISLFFKAILKSLQENFEELKCKNCIERNCVEFIIFPCEHKLCKKCMNYEDFCPVCQGSARICGFTFFKEIVGRMEEQLKNFNAIKNSLILHI